MKTLSIYAVVLFSIFTMHAIAQKNTVLNKNEKIKVWGNCESCKKRIENAAKAAGAVTAEWNEDSKILSVNYDNAKTSSEKIQLGIANKGYDTEGYTADQKVYDKLSGCCKYERKAVEATNSMKCCDKEKCEKEAGACKGMQCCKDMACCLKKQGAAMKCCGKTNTGTEPKSCCKM